MQLRGGTAHFHIETGRWKQIPRELCVCRECTSEDLQDIKHLLLGNQYGSEVLNHALSRYFGRIHFNALGDVLTSCCPYKMSTRSQNPAYRDINRRRIEAQLIQDLVKYLPLQHNEVEKISKGIVLRVALQYIKLHHLIDKTGNGFSSLQGLDPDWLRNLLKDKEKFLLIVDKSNTILYASERMTQLLGPLQVDTIGMMLSDLVHAEDHSVLNCMLTENSTHAGLIRMRDTMSPFVRSSEKVKYKVIRLAVFGRYHCKQAETLTVLECSPISVGAIPEITVNPYYEWTMDEKMNITDVDWRTPWVRGFSREDIIGKSCILFTFPQDVDHSLSAQKKAIVQLVKNGSFVAPMFRALLATGDWVWCRTVLTINGNAGKGRLTSFKCQEIIIGKYESEPTDKNTTCVQGDGRKSISHPKAPKLTTTADSFQCTSPAKSVVPSTLHHKSSPGGKPSQYPLSSSPFSGTKRQYTHISPKEPEYKQESLDNPVFEHSVVCSVSSPPFTSTETDMVDYSSLPSLSDLPTSNPPSVCSSSGCSSGEVSCSTEPLSDLSVEDVLGPPNDTSNDSGFYHQHMGPCINQKCDSSPLPDLLEFVLANKGCGFSSEFDFSRFNSELRQ